MKAIEIRDQPILGLRRTVQITANGVRYRLFRSAVTVGVVAVAVAFLMNILSESLIRRAIARRALGRIAELRLAATWVARLTNPGTVEELLSEVSQDATGEPALRDAARRAMEYLRFFDGLDYPRRRALLHDAIGPEALDALQEPAALDRFRSALGTLRSVRLPSTFEQFEGLLHAWPELKSHLLALRKKRAEGIAAVAARLDGRTLIEALADADGALGDAIRAAGFDLDPDTARRVAEQARRTHDARLVEKSVGMPEMRQAVAGYLDLLPNDVNVRTLWRLLSDPRGALWYLARQKETGGDAANLTADRLVELARAEEELHSLARAERMTVTSGGLTGSGERMDWLVLASMLVCVVGISNSMLMSVTERFREIATLKCLGALDGFIMLMFVLEAAFLGLVGGLLGAVLGAWLGFARMVVPFGSLVTASFPIGQMAVTVAVSAILGVVLAAVAAVYPSLKAARLAPMEAMRIQ
ncbi:MAG TPA: ABC transporter permease [Planctomycetota bacterium]|nr:ABC transporter permease [Planctomycetota bacterium]HRR81119.1 ABC transporter permease [Planctomycetota bacterium]HRT96552.1 ABC transporter permease [Planctomycetota bacterium]